MKTLKDYISIQEMEQDLIRGQFAQQKMAVAMDAARNILDLVGEPAAGRFLGLDEVDAIRAAAHRILGY